MSKTIQGCIAENRFKVIALSLEIPIYEPVIDMCGADFIIKKGDSFVKIQVKSTLAKEANRNSYKFNVQHGADNRTYSQGSYDIAALYIFELDIWYFIPFAKVISLTVRVNPFKESCKWHQYKNNYNCLT
jgi:hypothetical protein